MKYIFILATLLFLMSPVLVHAKEIRGWRDWPAGPTIISTEAPHNGLATVRFIKPEFAGKKVKIGVNIRYQSAAGYKGIKWDYQKTTSVLDKNGQGSIQLKGLKDRKTYNITVSLTPIEPHAVPTQPSKLKKLRTVH